MPGQVVITPSELVFNVTYRCPLRCSHCCFSSDMDKHGSLDSTVMRRAVDDAATHSNIERIDFVGGDPFLHPELLEQTLERSKAHGLGASATTSAYWASTFDKAVAVLAPLSKAGLQRIIISYDDMHAAFLKAKHVVNAYRAARFFDLEVYVAVVVEPGCAITREHIYEILDSTPDSDPKLHIYEMAINSTGRAKETADAPTEEARRRATQVYRGPCHSALRQFSVTPTGKVLPCCGVLPLRDEMVIGDLEAESIMIAMDRAYQDMVMKWIAFEGPVALLRQITSDTEQPFRDEDFDGICHACDVLFSSPNLMALLAEKLPAKHTSLAMTEMILEALGLYRPPQPALHNATTGASYAAGGRSG